MQKFMNKQKKIEFLESEVSRLQSDLNTSNNNFENANTNHELALAALKKEKDELVESLEKDLERMEWLIDTQELKKLAKAYEEQEKEYGKGVTFWGKWLFWIAVIFLIYAGVSGFLAHGEPWSNKLEYYIIDLILFGVLWFCSSQYTENLNLKNNYANRKTLAQSFSNILNTLPENEPIKEKFIEKTTDILCATNPVSGKEPVLSKEATKQLFELIKLTTWKIPNN